MSVKGKEGQAGRESHRSIRKIEAEDPARELTAGGISGCLASFLVPSRCISGTYQVSLKVNPKTETGLAGTTKLRRCSLGIIILFFCYLYTSGCIDYLREAAACPLEVTIVVSLGVVSLCLFLCDCSCCCSCFVRLVESRPRCLVACWRLSKLRAPNKIEEVREHRSLFYQVGSQSCYHVER